MTFRVGQKVVCIKEGGWTDGGGFPSIGEIHPTKGNVYTIRFMDYDESGETFLILEDFAWHYASVQFKPVRTTDIAIFKAMLVTPPKQRVSA